MDNLQYTLLLLIPTKSFNNRVSIGHLQYTLLLLIQFRERLPFLHLHNLQYTLLLLIPKVIIKSTLSITVFTIHFATINTLKSEKAGK